ncbi:MAG TPA: lytic transglycosylase domain-containing protein [Stellaceae bacterium]|jgi:hypothetical protein|nr:lytic transglycosylase domain-containing protein [Stellaceae bacterium]
MDLVTFVAACALGFRAELFIPLVARDYCSASDRLGTAAVPRNGLPNIERWAGYIVEAALRFRRPEAWVRAVMQAESSGVADAISPAGAMGLMQIMPDTYAELRARYGLGADPYDPHDNIMAGTAYMSEMIELFGVPNFLAAYNAGPARLDDHLRRGRPLPAETMRYLAQIGELPAVPLATSDVAATQSPGIMDASLNAPSASPRTSSSTASVTPMISAGTEPSQHRRPHEIAEPSGLFVQKWTSPTATFSSNARRPNDARARLSGALFVPLGAAPVRISAASASMHLE